jgi:hypothetical protein
MTAWEQLVAGSTLTSGTAWEHLHAQGGGSSGDVYVVNAGSAELSAMTLAGAILSAAMAADVAGEVSAALTHTLLGGNIDA